jgi:hypothetical protein
MTLSMLKLEELLRSNGFLINKKFMIHGYAVYLEIFNINNAEIFLLYIPSKYEIYVEERTNAYKIKYIDLNEDDIENIKDKTETIDIEKEYEDINVQFSPEKGEDLEKTLKDNYANDIALKDVNKEDINSLKDILYQLSRLKLCIKNIKYKLSILYKNYLCCVKRDNTIECFIIKNYPKQDEKNIYITTDLENLFSKVGIISSEIRVVKDNVYKILNNNQIKNTILLNNILEQKKSIILSSESILNKKKELDIYILRLETLLKNVNESEKKVIEKIIKSNKNNIEGLHGDIQKSHEIYRYEKEIDNMNNIKQEIVKDIIKLRNKKENLTLEIDRILFDNAIMFNLINKNFNKLLKSL